MTKQTKKSYEDLEKENRLLHAIIESVSDGVYAVDKDGTILVYNSAFGKIEGTSKWDVLGKRDCDIYPVPVEKYLRLAVLKNKKPLKEQYMTYTSVNEKKVDIVYDSFPFFENGELNAVYAICRDLPSINELTTKLLDRFNRHVSKNKKNGTNYSLDDIVGNSSKIIHAKSQSHKVATINSTVMILGETGSGKELFAQGIHNAGPYASRPFIAVNCAAIPDNLMESLMMGTVKGAFSGAIDAPGFFEQAKNGTLFLDEINSLSVHLQPKLLRLLQDKTVRRIGDKTERKIECRIICATNQDLFDLAQKGKFREDLLYRLTPVIISIPPLKEHLEDIPLLIEKFINDFNKEFNLNIKELGPDLLDLFYKYNWPGNVRELEHTIESAMSMAEKIETTLTINHLPAIIRKRIANNFISNLGKNNDELDGQTLSNALSQCEKKVIETTLKNNNGNVAASAKQLGIARQNLHYRIRKLGLNTSEYKN